MNNKKQIEAFTKAFTPSDIHEFDGKLYRKINHVRRIEADIHGIYYPCKECCFEPPTCDNIQCSDWKTLWQWEEVKDVQ